MSEEEEEEEEYSSKRQEGGLEKEVIDSSYPNETNLHLILRYFKIFLLFLWWIGIFILIVLYGEKPDNPTYLATSANRSKDVMIKENITNNKIRLRIEGPFAVQKYDIGIGVLLFSNNKELHLRIQKIKKDENGVEIERINLSNEWIVKLVDENDLEKVDIVSRSIILKLTADDDIIDSYVHVETNMESLVALTLQCELVPTSNHFGFLMGCMLIIVYYILIIFEMVPRTFAAILVCTMSIGILGWIYARPSFPEILKWMNIDMFMVQFGISLIVTLTVKSGIYDWLAVRTFKQCRGHVWPFLYIMISILFIMSLVFETTMVIILIGPFVLLMCQLMAINSIPVVIILTCFVQIGEIALPYSSLLNHRVYNQPYLVEKDITAQGYIKEGLLFCLLIFLTSLTYLRIVFRDSSKIGMQETEADALKRIIDVLDETAKAIAGYTKDEQAVKQSVERKVVGLKIRLKRIGKMPKPIEKFEEKLELYHSKMGIRNKFILIASIFPLVFILFMTIVNFFKNDEPMAIGWTVILSALLFIIIIGENDFEELLYNIDWTTFIFLACRYVFTCALNAMWIEESIGQGTHDLIHYFDNKREWVAPVLIFWIASISACLLDNIAVANTMIRVVSLLSVDDNLNVKLKPLVYATTFGLHVGGMGTQISSMSSIVFSGLVERHALRYPFFTHFKICFPLMIINNIVSTIYIILVYC